MKRAYIYVILVSLLFEILACRFSGTPTYQEVDIPTRPVEVTIPDGYNPALGFWLPNGNLAVLFSNDNPLDDYLIPYVIEGNPEILYLELENDPACKISTFYTHFYPLPDGRLGMVKTCNGQFPVGNLIQDARYLMAYDWKMDSLEQLVSEELPHAVLGYFSFNPTITRGVQSLGTLHSTIFWLTLNGTEPMEIEVRDNNQSFPLSTNYYTAINLQEDVDTGVARYPDWSPDGKKIVFLANLDAIGKEGMYRTQGEWGMYLMDVQNLTPQKVLGGIYGPSAVKWSPDSKWIAFNAKINSQEGLWLYSPAKGELFLLNHQREHLRGLVWSNDGTKILSIVCTETQEECLHNKSQQVWEFDLSHFESQNP